MKARIRIEQSPFFTEYYTEKYDKIFGWERMHWCSFKTKDDAKYAIDLYLWQMEEISNYKRHLDDFETLYESYP